MQPWALAAAPKRALQLPRRQLLHLLLKVMIAAVLGLLVQVLVVELVWLREQHYQVNPQGSRQRQSQPPCQRS